MTRGKSLPDDSRTLRQVLTPVHRVLAIYNGNIYDLSDYLQTLADNNGGSGYSYLDGDIVALFKQQPGQDITKSVDQVYASMDTNKALATKICLNNLFYILHRPNGLPKGCTMPIPNYLLLAFSALIALTIVAKCEFLSLSPA